MIPSPRSAVVHELAFQAKARHVRVRKSVHDQHDLGDDEDEDKDEPAD
jgi:hypothetical protein